MKKCVSVQIRFDRVLFGKLVRDYRLEAELTQKDVADLCDMSEGFVSGIERGLGNQMTINSMLLIINALDIPVWRYALWVAD